MRPLLLGIPRRPPLRPFLGAAVLLVTAGLLTGCARPPEPFEAVERHGRPGAPANVPVSPACPESGLLIRSEDVNAAMGLRVMTLEVVNCDTSRHVVEGYPDVRVLGKDHAPLDVGLELGAASFGTAVQDAGPTRLTLRPGERAVAGLAWRNTVDTTGEPANGAFLSVAPAPGAARQEVPELIDLGTTGKLGTTAWARPRAS
ncbi:DUF4232 domain-containing protein [Streptomyces sp. UNOC14_S4]|uniref:DUF4232 domain-containing protein n=1 Tax=Streptomyces sp. UNOC14_S4 TaxID=2872340 RepID=UPI001E542237|nr:DUF4232 domain-containing protein [Streptomyces sp. UNOC14_S4]MCC3771481.1 DUF4232 domain-containing protein [Streptomyces sp. UNOC14_S4]